MNSMGERIYELRKKNNMSQGDLADELDTSRQTISKWENNMSIPEIEKITQLSLIFSVTTDYIIKGKEEIQHTLEEKKEISTAVKEKGKTNSRKVISIILIILGCVAFVVFSFSMQLLTLSGIYLIGLGTLLLLCKKHTGLFISWYTFVLVERFFSSFTTVSLKSVFYEHYYSSQLMLQLIVAYIMWIVFAILILCTIATISKARKKRKQQ